MKFTFQRGAMLFIVVATNCFASQVNPSPVGTWQATISGQDKGIGYLTFDAGGTLTGYGISINSLGFFELSGTWTVNSKGQLLGNYTEILGSQSYGGSFVGKAVNGKNIKASAIGQTGKFNLKGVPATSVPDISGSNYVAEVRESGTTIVETYDITATDVFGVFDLSGVGSGPDGAFTISGEVIADSQGKVAVFSEDEFGLADLIGSFNLYKGTASLKGKSDSGLPISIKVTQ